MSSKQPPSDDDRELAHAATVQAFSPDGRRVALADGRNALVEVDVASGAVIRRVQDIESQIARAVYSGDELLVARAQFVGDLWLAEGRFE